MRVFVLGANGRVGSTLARCWRTDARVGEVVALTRAHVEFSDPAAAEAGLALLGVAKGDVVVNCAAATDVDACERDPEMAHRVNAETPGRLARLCAARNARFVHLGTDYVFDGLLDRPYTEDDEARPCNHYGRSKLAGDLAVLAASAQHVVARVSWVFGPSKPSFVDGFVRRALASSELSAVSDKTSSPTYTEDLAVWLAAFLDAGVPGGLYHLCNAGTCSWREYGEHALVCARRHGIPVLTTTVAARTLADMAFTAVRPPRTPLDTVKFARATGMVLQPWQSAVDTYFSSWSANRS